MLAGIDRLCALEPTHLDVHLHSFSPFLISIPLSDGLHTLTCGVPLWEHKDGEVLTPAASTR